MSTLLLEIGTEEIPAGYIEPALTSLSEQLRQKLTDNRLSFGDVHIMGTPRRLTIQVTNVAAKQEPLKAEILGPPASIGFDSDGNPTMAAQKFAEKSGVSIKDIRVTETKKGAYLCADIIEEGLPAEKILEKILPELIQSIPFPKTMKWADLTIQFARPIHWILALLGNKIISFKLGNLTSGNITRGHRFMNPAPISIPQPDVYVDKLKAASVIVDFEERKRWVEKEITRVAQELGGDILPDSELVDIVKNLVEYPIAVAGKFEEKYLEVPDEVLITAMREHQKYFAVIDKNKKLMPCFIAVNNTKAKDMSLVAKGHERVLRARLSDAQFFYKSDLEISFDTRIEKLKGVLFQAKLGTMYEKIHRVQEIAAYICDELRCEKDVKSRAIRAAQLCKADLVSHVVGEFPKLQGIMGRIYANKSGEHPETASAIEEHYRPTYSGGPLPQTLTGSIVAIADKIDSICGCFCVGLIPTGASDPYALRRQSIGIIQIMIEKQLNCNLSSLIKKSAQLFADKSEQDIRSTTDAVYSFFQNRISHILAEEGFSKDVIAAVVGVSIDHIPNVRNRVKSLEKLKTAPDFEQLAIAFKRVVNIVRKAESETIPNEVNKNLFEQETETTLYHAFKSVQDRVSHLLDQANFEQALLEIASLRRPVDEFFDSVLVMADDVNIRRNRLAMLKQIGDMFNQFADFSKIST